MAKRTITTVAELQGGSAIHLGAQVGEIVGGLRELRVDPDVVDEIHAALTDVADLLRGAGFSRIGVIGRSSFGARDTAETLSYHHGRAHQVMTDTLRGIRKDLNAFASAVRRAAEDLSDTDASTGADLARRKAAGDTLAELGRRSFGDAANDRSRNQVRDPFQRRPGGR